MTQVKIYEANHKNRTFGTLLKEMFTDLFSSLGLAKRLFIRDKSAEYRQSFLGIFWAVITPLATAMVWVFLSASGAVKISGTGIPYPLYVFLGTMIWGIFSESLQMPLMQTNASKALISKINFPKEAILMSGIYKTLFNTGIKLLIMVGVLLFYGYYPDFGYLPFLGVLLLLIMFGVALGLLITPVGMLYTDIGKVIPIALPFLMYLVPVVYRGTGKSSLQTIIHYNPLTPLLQSCRNLLTHQSWENPAYLMIILLATIILLFIGWIFYRVSIPIIVERM
ncbi:ABC transporter permease [Epilithonimonas hominis]|uniref:Lipopolysaccharide transport system permease protein n=1 Tax=Epilithonimonas hominis TaxID=420404 RepID=A0A1H6IKX5_9FLAO|nr:ABC transporter permease [Epilithonimonas hominis]SEH47603.1 lipopolysaccharide transport system permease protein [Epilithonimonas hominis]